LSSASTRKGSTWEDTLSSTSVTSLDRPSSAAAAGYDEGGGDAAAAAEEEELIVRGEVEG
jgi:hypothetical protein